MKKGDQDGRLFPWKNWWEGQESKRTIFAPTTGSFSSSLSRSALLFWVISHILALLWIFILCFRIWKSPHQSPWPFSMLLAAAAHWMANTLTNYSIWSHVIQWLFLILTISCEVLTCMLTHSLPLPRPSLGRWGSCRGQWEVIEPLLKNMWVTWRGSANVTQIILTGSATEG